MSVLVVQSPARLHFGLTEICPGQPMLFGGCGMTIEAPSMQLSFETLSSQSSHRYRWQIDRNSPWNKRIDTVLACAHQAIFGTIEPPLDAQSEATPLGLLRVEKPPLAHAGLGSGTQLACCVATLVAAARRGLHIDSPLITANSIWKEIASASDTTMIGKLAEATGRGARSYVGLASHLLGGFIVDHGSSIVSSSIRTFDRFCIPDSWYVVLARPNASTTISGALESHYFHRCAVPNPALHWMIDLIAKEMIPAIQACDLPRFGEALHRYGRYGGELFRTVQGGVYRDTVVSELVEFIRSQGIMATGQTSWGPTVYAIVENQNEAIELDERLRNRFGESISTMISRPSNQPATVRLGTR